MATCNIAKVLLARIWRPFGDLLGAAQDGGEDGNDACMEAMFDVYKSFA
jgi:hypothetical protein